MSENVRERFLQALYSNVALEVVSEARRLIRQGYNTYEELTKFENMGNVAVGVIMCHIHHDDAFGQDTDAMEEVAAELAERAIEVIKGDGKKKQKKYVPLHHQV